MSWMGAIRCSYWPVASPIWKHCRAAERHWNADQSRPRHRWGSGCQCDSSDPPGRSFTGSSLHISVYQHVSSLGQMCTTCTWKHTRKTVSKKRQKTKNKTKRVRTHVTEEQKNNTLVLCHQVTRLFFLFLFFFYRFIFYRGGVQSCNPTPKSLSLRLSVVMETSQVSVLPAVAPAVHCGIRGSLLKIWLLWPNVVRPSAKATNRLTSAVYCLCECLLGTFACRPA